MTERPAVSLWPSTDKRAEYRWTGEPIADDRLRALALGAYVDRDAHYVDSIRRDCLHHPSDPTGCAAAALSDSWGITSAVDLRRTVARLLDGMHTAEYEEVFPLAEKAGAAVRDGRQLPAPHSRDDHRRFLAVRETVLGRTPGSLLTAYEAVYRLFAMNLVTHLTADKYLPRHIRSWDLARVPIVVRSAVTVGMIAEDEGWELLSAALRRAQDEYHDWEMFSDGILAGRAYWLALGDIAEVEPEEKRLSRVIHDLFEAPSSPWRRVSLHP
ncbi:DUF1266 domain-containing protein [Tsukamurella strandjordii]|uniref:DUF1266 domain-containing protein n=1 Tax=Tsukamurella strandjordii TaxID=147577 RepID=A0AA90N729_9ACTN|nr:DUF1266 domain-containing protein [Tsukamurella strandjordii]MDP0396766.1 DUF1266 domain-containing protein [Tsukamurella strandjordii]